MPYTQVTVSVPGQTNYLVGFPIDAHLCVYENGVLASLGDDYTVNMLTGEVVFGTAPGLGSTLEFRRL